MKKNKIKMNKLGISLVIAMYVFELLLAFEVNSGVVSAAASAIVSSQTSFVYSSASSNPQYMSPGGYQSYSQQYVSTYWPALANPDQCKAETDFIMNIVPGSCTPLVVRSDLLEEQNVPIFCKVNILKINPLIDITNLKSVKFAQTSSNPYVAGVSFHPNAEAIYSRKAYTDNPLINDVGYVVVVLKQIPAEKDMPDSIRVNLTGVLSYDSEGLFGPGKSQYYLRYISDEEWGKDEKYKENSFFKGKGFLRAEWIEEGKAEISIYSDEDERIATFELIKGETSRLIYMPGFYCRAGVQVRLDDLVARNKRVKLRVGEDYLWLVEGEKFLDGNCRVVKIWEDKDKTARNVSISCKGQKPQTLGLPTNKKEETPTQTGTKTEEKTGENKETPKDVMENYEKARKYAESIVELYGNVVSSGSREIWAAQALYKLGVLAENIGLGLDASEIYNRIITEYPETPYAWNAQDRLGSIENPSQNYEGVRITLIEIDLPEKDDASADFIITDLNKNNKNGEISEIKGVMEGEKFTDRFELVRLYPNKVDLAYYDKNGKKQKTFSLDLLNNKVETFDDYRISLQDINMEAVAKVSVIARMPSDYSEADFIFEVGIEKRAIQLSPEKIKEKIASLNETIVKWENIVEKLGKVVSAMKGVCLATSTLLLIKNFFSNLEGGTMARQKIMPVYYTKCQQESEGDKARFDACLNKYNADIEKGVDTYVKKINEINEEVIKIQNDNLYPGTETVDRKKATEAFKSQYMNQEISYQVYDIDKETGELKPTLITQTINIGLFDKASLTQLRDLKLYSEIYNSDLSDDIKKDAARKMETIRIELDKKAKGTTGALYPETGDREGWLGGVPVEYYMTGNTKNFVKIVPLPGSYSINSKPRTGFYVYVPENSYDASGNFNRFYIQNIGDDSYLDVYDDPKFSVDMNQDVRNVNILGATGDEAVKLVQNAKEAVREAADQYGRSRATILGKMIPVKLSGFTGEKRCTDFMSPQDCKILFNVCDPVICPASRCDLGGAYRVDNVIQSGIIGSIALCLPNIREGIVVPVCLSGIHAGLDAYVQILKSYRDCLQEQLNSGKVTGICDEIQSIYLCEFFWRQIGPYLDILFYKMIEASYGQGMKGGGEYLTVQESWENLHNSIAYIRDEYAVKSYKAFQARSTGDIGSEFCKAFVSASYPNNKNFFDNLLQPDSPVQYHAWFDEIPYTTVTLPATSQYKVFYNIYAGKDEGVSYQVYLKNPPESAYVRIQEVVIVKTGFIPKGGYVSETKDLTAPAGYQELCVRINGQDNCGFKKVSTSFALNYISDAYYQEQLANTDIKTEEECISGTPSLAGILTTPNIQAGVETSISPELEKKGVVRICSTTDPGAGVEKGRWIEVGFCDDESVKCWLDKESVQEVVKNKNIEKDVLKTVEAGKEVSNLINEIGVMSAEEAGKKLNDIERDIINNLEKQINDKEKTVGEKKALIDNVLTSIDSGIVVSEIKMNMKDIMDNLTDIENRAETNSLRAEAVYNKFRIYEIITKGLYDNKETTGATVEKQATTETQPEEIQTTPATTERGFVLEDNKILLDGQDTKLFLKEQKVGYSIYEKFWYGNKWVGSIINRKIEFDVEEKTSAMTELEKYTFDGKNFILYTSMA